MTGGRRFSSPDWGQDHLSLDAIVAFVDDELTAGPQERAEAHLDRCRECRAEVVTQRQARTALRGAGGPCLPSSLLRSLRSIPVEAELPPPPPGLGVTADGRFVLLRDVPRPAPEPHAPRRFSRRARAGAVSGLALGALAVGALAAPAQPVPSGPGVLGGDVLNVPVQARLSPSPAVPAVLPASVPAVNPTAVPSPRPDATGPDATGPDATGPGATGPGATEEDATVAPTDGALDPALRARLESAPIAFHHNP